MNDSLYQLERRVLMMELALRKHGIEIEDFQQPHEEVLEPIKTPKQLRESGQPYCPKCFTFGSSHRKDCPNASFGMSSHVRMAVK